MRQVTSLLSIAMILVSCLNSALNAEPIKVRYAQGSSHGFIALKTLDGKTIATGESTQTVQGDRVTSRLVFHFLDGSIDDDTTVFTQKIVFRLVSDHHVQRGPSFPKPIDFLIKAGDGELLSRDESGRVTTIHMDLPDDVSNGLPPNLLLSIPPTNPVTKISYVAPGAKPRLVVISIKPTGIVPFRVGTLRRKATDFTLHVELGGIAGVAAPLVGKQPSDYHIWLENGSPPAFVREEGAFYKYGPIWRMEEASPSIRP